MIKKEIQIHPNPKQFLAWQALNNPDIAEIHYGGGAGGGKTWLGCESRIARAYAYPGYKSFIGRNQLTRLMATCFVSFQKVCKFHGIPDGHWKLNGKYNYIEFINTETGKFDGRGSRIDLLDLSYQPSDPMYERLGSLEYTDGGWIDEAGEVPFMAVDILQSRGGRHMNEEFRLDPDTLYTYNPNKGWVYRVHKKYKEGTLDKDIVFIKALYSDNPHTERIYGKQLDRIKDPAMKKRLKEGSFDYDNDPASLINSDAIVDLFTNTLLPSEDKFMTGDIARHGVDYTVLYLWRGWTLYGVRIYAKQDTLVTSNKARDIVRDERIPYSHVMIDEDGIGGAVVDNNHGFRGFIANSTPLLKVTEHGEEKENFGSLKSQSTYKLADIINTHKMAINITPGQFVSEVEGITLEVWKDMFIEELEAIKSKDIDKDTTLKVRSKEEVKMELGRSPDFSDTAMFRAPFEYPLPELSFGDIIVHYPD